MQNFFATLHPCSLDYDASVVAGRLIATVLALIIKRTGRTPAITKDVKTVFDENYAEEPQ